MVANVAVFLVMPPVFVIAALAMPAGVGGGMLYVPLMVMMGVVKESRVAAALSQPLIFGATLAAIVYNLAWQRRHPGKMLMEPEIALAAIPSCLAGTLVGAFLNQLLPNIIIHLLLFLVLALSIRNTLLKALSMWRKESSSKKAAAAAVAPAAPAVAVVGATEACAVSPAESDTNSTATPEMTSQQMASQEMSSQEMAGQEEEADMDQDTPHAADSAWHLPEQLAKSPKSSIGEGEMRRRTVAALEAGEAQPSSSATSTTTSTVTADTPAQATSAPVSVTEKASSRTKAWSMVFVVWSILVLSLVLRGGKGNVSVIGVRMCSWEYWLITSVAFIFLLAVSLYVRHDDVKPGVCFGVGALSSIVGIGGGIVLNPMLLGAGIEPAVTTATVTVMITMVSSNATINFLLANAIPPVPTLTLTTATFLGSLCGKLVVGWLVAKTGRSSILVFMLCGFMIVSTIAVLIQGTFDVMDEVSGGLNPFVLFQDPCA